MIEVAAFKMPGIAFWLDTSYHGRRRCDDFDTFVLLQEIWPREVGLGCREARYYTSYAPCRFDIAEETDESENNGPIHRRISLVVS